MLFDTLQNIKHVVTGASITKSIVKSGTVNTTGSANRRIIFFNRTTMTMVGSVLVRDDFSWDCLVEYTAPGELLGICLDDSGQFNVDGWDALSICAVDYEFGTTLDATLIGGPAQNYRIYHVGNDGLFAYAGAPAIEDVKGTAIKYVVDTLGTSGHFENGSGTPVTHPTVETGSISALGGVTINSPDTAVADSVSIPADHLGTSHTLDLFSDASCKLYMPFVNDLEPVDATHIVQAHSVIIVPQTGGAGLQHASFSDADYDTASYAMVYGLGLGALNTAVTVSFTLRYTDNYCVFFELANALKIGVYANDIRFSRYTGASYASWEQLTYNLGTGTVRHFVIKLDATSAQLWVNGTLRDTNSGNKMITSAQLENTLWLGRQEDLLGASTSYDALSGQMGHLRIFNRGIDSAEATIIYNEAFNTSPPTGAELDLGYIHNIVSTAGSLLNLKTLSDEYNTITLDNNKDGTFGPFTGTTVASVEVDETPTEEFEVVVFKGGYENAGMLRAYRNNAPNAGYFAFDGDPATFWSYDFPNTFPGETTDYRLCFDVAKTLTGINLLTEASGTYPTALAFSVYGSQDDVVANETLVGDYTFPVQTTAGAWTGWTAITNATAYKYYRFVITSQQFAYSRVAIADSVYSVLEYITAEQLTGRSFIVDIADNYGGSFLAIRSILPTVAGRPIDTSSWTFYATSVESGSTGPELMFDVTKPMQGADTGSWKAASGTTTNQRIIAVSPTDVYFDDVKVLNYHDNYTAASVVSGAKTISVQVSQNVITDTTYGAAVANSWVLFSGDLPQHSDSTTDVDIALPGETVQLFSTLQKKAPTLARSVAIDIENNHGSSTSLTLRRIEFWNRGCKVPYSGAWTAFTSSGANPSRAFDTSLTYSGAYTTKWEALSGVVANTRIGVMFPAVIEFDEIKVVNSRSQSGSAVSNTTRGINHVSIKCSTSATQPASTYQASLASEFYLTDSLWVPESNSETAIIRKWTLDWNLTESDYYEARSVVVDVHGNWGADKVGLNKLEFWLNDERISDKYMTAFTTTTFASSTAAALIDQSGYHCDLITTDTSTVWIGDTGTTARFVVVFAAPVKFNRIVYDPSYMDTSVDDYRRDRNPKAITIYTTPNVLDGSDAIYDIVVPNGSTIFDGICNMGLRNAITQRVPQVMIDRPIMGSKYFKRLLLHSNTTNGATLFEDSSFYENGIVAAGTAITHSTAQSAVGTSSIITSIGWLESTDTTKFALGDSDFRIGAFIFPTNTSLDKAFISKWDSANNQKGFKLGVNAGNLSFRFTPDGSTETEILSTATITQNAWTYVEVVRVKGSLLMRIGGIIDNTYAIGNTVIWNSSSRLNMGSSESLLANCWQGYIDEVDLDISGVVNPESVVVPSTLIGLDRPLEETSTVASYSFTFDGGSTYNVWNPVGSAWREITSNDASVHGNAGDSDWYFRDSADVWSKVGVANKQEALSAAAIQGSINRNRATTVNALATAQWHGTGGISTGRIDSAISMRNASRSYTVFNGITFNTNKLWLSEVFDISTVVDTIDTTTVSWQIENAEGLVDFDAVLAGLKVYAMKTGGAGWIECTNGSEIPGIPNGTDTTGISIQFKIEHPILAGAIDEYAVQLYFDIK